MGTIKSSLFSIFVMDYAVNQTKITFSIAGLVYLIAFLFLAVYVKEGEYPPVEDKITRGNPLKNGVEYVVMFFRQCFCRKIFIFYFLCTGLNQASNICRSMFNLLFATKDIGMDIKTYGVIAGIGTLVSAAAIIPMGKVMDKTSPILIFGLGGILIMLMNVFGFFFVDSVATFGVIGVVTSLMYAIQHLAGTPLSVALLPREKYGQMAGGANTMVNSGCMLVASFFAGYFTDKFGYRVMFVWDFVVTMLAMVALWVVYTEWKRYGGKENYTPPEVA